MAIRLKVLGAKQVMKKSLFVILISILAVGGLFVQMTRHTLKEEETPAQKCPKRRKQKFEQRQDQNIFWCKGAPMQMLDSHPKVALASFPGSGNTWTRYLLQQATGVLTSSVYKDNDASHDLFSYKKIKPKKALVVKTHFPFKPKGNIKFDKVILLIRNLSDTILAYFNWQMSGAKLGRATLQDFTCRNRTQWRYFVLNNSQHWIRFYYYWLGEFAREKPSALLLVRYEDLKNDTARMLKMMLKFLHRQEEASEENINCVVSQIEGPYHRAKDTQGFDAFALEGGEALKQELDEIGDSMYSMLGESGEK